MRRKEPSDSKILSAVFEADKELFEQGVSLADRSREIVPRTRQRLGLGVVIAQGPFQRADILSSRVKECYSSVYGSALSRRSYGHGVVEFRGVPYLVKVPVVYGRTSIDPFAWSDLTDTQLYLIKNNRQLFESAVFQIGDAFDAVMGFASALSVDRPRSFAKQLATEAHKNFLAACTLAAHAWDVRECFHSAFIALELCMKSVLASKGFTEQDLKKYGHKLDKLVSALSETGNTFEIARVRSVVRDCPNFADARYGDQQISETEAVEFLIGTQFTIAEMMRPSLSQSLLANLDSSFCRPSPPKCPDSSA